MKEDTAKQVNAILIESVGKLNESAMIVRKGCSDEEIKSYLKPISHIISIMFDVLDDIHKKYPELKPDNIK